MIPYVMPLLIMEKGEYEKQFRGFIGKRIIRVRYYEIEYPDAENMWQHDERFDSLDFGLDILSEDNFFLAISWGSEFHQYGISSDQNHLPTSNEYRCIDVSKTSRWGDFLNTKITDVRIVWSWIKESGFFKRKILYPQELIFSFDNNRNIFISALQIDTDDSFIGMTDNITVIFDKDIAKKFKVRIELKP